MSIIKVLPDNLVNQIAAGEVVERPASVVKELVENSIDAGADQIVIEAKTGGKTLVRVVDNGKGMNRDDAENSLLRHATSKIIQESDLWNISTMGFRGEALASISSVSQMVLRTKTSGGRAGTEIICDGGEVKTIQDCGMKDGTSIEVNNLFFNTPARGNYLKKDSTELTHIISLLNKIALAHPGIAFKFVHNDKVQFDFPSTSSLERRISDIFGKSTSDAMIPVFYGGSDFKLSGFVGKPAISRADSRHQYLFVNGRPIQHYLIAYKVKETFRSMLMEGKKPIFILNIKIDPSLIDVNVHPRKVEIRFEDESGILKTVYSAVKVALEKHDLTPAYSEAGRYMSDRFPKSETPVDVGEIFTGNGAGFAAPSPTSPMKFDLGEESSPSLKAVTQVSNSYIVAQNEDGLVLIDQHAAHERVRYFELLDQFETAKKNIQPLLMPEELSLTLDEIEVLKTEKEFFEGLGFEIESGPDGVMTLYAVPLVLSKDDMGEVIHGVLADIGKEKKASNLQGRREMVLHYMSCRSAVKFGQKLSIDEMNALLEQMEMVDRPYTCPHGRPTMIKLTFSELERMFGRK
jgi:DNA mismatch repair protein MutL